MSASNKSFAQLRPDAPAVHDIVWNIRDPFPAAVHRQPEITECLLVTGNLDYVLRLRVRDVEALRDFILAKLKSIPCAAETATMLVLEASKSVETVAVRGA